jgi:hypothetical protein
LNDKSPILTIDVEQATKHTAAINSQRVKNVRKKLLPSNIPIRGSKKIENLENFMKKKQTHDR